MSTAEDKWREATREVEMRNRVYPRWVGQGKMSLKESIQRIRVMTEIAADYYEQMEKERLL